MRKTFVAILIIITIVVALPLWWQNGIKAANPTDKTQKIFVIAKGEGVRNIANKLKKEGLIKDPVVFFLLIKRLGLDNKIQAGDFRLSASMSAGEIAQTLISGRLDVWIVIPEGKRAEEVAEILKANIPSYQESWKTTLSESQGYLFPDTYLIPKDADLDLIVSVMRKNFEDKYTSIQLVNSQNFTQEQMVIIASLIEREAKFPQDRPLVASVIFNRLAINMALQVDATVQYALGYQSDTKTWWKKDLTKGDLMIDSPYNTYLYPGLPPKPIANPGLAALTAAANPTKTSFRYYISDKAGHNHYATTLDEHNENIKKYGI